MQPDQQNKMQYASNNAEQQEEQDEEGPNLLNILNKDDEKNENEDKDKNDDETLIFVGLIMQGTIVRAWHVVAGWIDQASQVYRSTN